MICDTTEDKAEMKIYAMTHKKCQMPLDSLYVPMQVGRAIHKPLGYMGDDTGENISAQNPFYSELTGMYWLWKNDQTDDYIGMCHYRRFLIDENGKLLKEEQIRQILENYDLITTKQIQLNCTYYDGFAVDHNQRDMDIVAEIIRQTEPRYYDTFLRTVHDTRTYFGNMLITSKKHFDNYAAWLFGIFDKAEQQIDMNGYDGYQKRLYGFISEILLLVWLKVNKLKVYECKVGMIGEKKETREMEEQLAQYFREKNIQGAKQYFLNCLAVRPDVLMEASDVYGDLKAAMQVIATAEYEMDAHGRCILDQCTDFQSLTELFKELDAVMERQAGGVARPEDDTFLAQQKFSPEAIMIAQKIAEKM